MPVNQLNISNCNLFTQSREDTGGNAVALYVNEDVPAYPIAYLEVPPELECLWIKVRPKKLLRSISAIAVCAVYITTKSPLQPLLLEHLLLSSVEFLRSKYPDIAF